jgi:hypothetical protein
MSEEMIEVDKLPSNIAPDAIYVIDQSNPNRLTHGMFKYPCKFIPEIPRWAINRYIHGVSNDVTVFDPFAGSGTTLLEGISFGVDSFGTEIDPLAKKIIKAKTTTLSNEELAIARQLSDNLITDVSAITDYSVAIPSIGNLNHWFTQEAIEKLARLRLYISMIGNENIRDLFEITFASIIKKCSNADDTSPKPYVSSKIKKNPAEVYGAFSRTLERYLLMEYELASANIKAKAALIDGDALNFKTDGKFSLAITSPPYINAFDYPRTFKLENMWLGNLSEKEVLESKSDYVGTEKINVEDERADLTVLDDSAELKKVFTRITDIDPKRALIVKKFFDDMKLNLELVYDSLISGGRYVVVIGNSRIRKQKVESWRILTNIAEHIGFAFEGHFGYLIQNPYIRIPRKNRGGLISLDHVVILQKE